jgi:hypothetical protein
MTEASAIHARSPIGDCSIVTAPVSGIAHVVRAFVFVIAGEVFAKLRVVAHAVEANARYANEIALGRVGNRCVAA